MLTPLGVELDSQVLRKNFVRRNAWFFIVLRDGQLTP